MAAALWFKRLILLAPLLALTVVGLGAYVRLSDAGLGCPDWPGCYGQLSVPQHPADVAAAASAYPDKPLEQHKAWKEMLHRYLAGTLGLVILALCVLGWRGRLYLAISPWLPTLTTALVALQAMLGMWTVTLLLKPAVVSAHLLGGMLTLALLVWMAHRHWGRIASSQVTSTHHVWIRMALIVVLLQIVLGGWTSANYAALACTDFPACQGSWIPTLNYADAYHVLRELGQGPDGSALSADALVTIQWTHRLGALLTLIVCGTLAFSLLNKGTLTNIALVLLLLLVCQISLGIANVLLRLPLVLAVSHNVFAALLLSTLVVLNSTITPLKQPEET
ncbi:heme A synthase [Methylovorus sp. MP688]|uniref:COX15/CtaA family protein n=1 Tax=Methylovorus sp. (strain MP688) TaxID=887061 RepID=UPI0001EC46DB|nr:COX15/CtaA family protein [Methylovorus sp. MP688]ADQ84442.1 cytochrome oxidase assembly [Methylovorus sp. MP688]